MPTTAAPSRTVAPASISAVLIRPPTRFDAANPSSGLWAARMTLLDEILRGLGYEVSFTSEPHSTKEPAPGGVRDEDVVEYEEVS